jgi:hypothetical protein
MSAAMEPASHSLIPSDRRSRLLLGAILLAWLWPFPYFNTVRPSGTINNPNEVTRVYAVAALVDDGTWHIGGPIARFGGVDDKAKRSAKSCGRHGPSCQSDSDCNAPTTCRSRTLLYSSKAPGTTLLGAPVYRLVRLFSDPWSKRELTALLRYAINLPFALWLLLLLRRRCAEWGDETIADSVMLLAGVGSMLYPYTLLFTGHLQAAACAFAAFEFSLRRDRRGMILFGLCAAATPAMEYPHALMILPIGLRFLRAERRHRIARRALFAAVGGALPIAATCYAQAAMFGSWYKTGYSFLENRAYEALHGAGFFGIGTPDLGRIGAALFSPEVGLFFFSPALIFGAIVWLWHPRSAPFQQARGTVVWMIALELLFLAGHGGWRGGWTIGPRYILPLVPFLLLGIAGWHGRRHLLAGSIGLSVLLCGIPSAFYPHLSDVFANPWGHFVLPLLKAGYAPAQGGPWSGGAALGPAPILIGLAILALAASRLCGGRRGLIMSFPLLLLAALVVRGWPERDLGAAQAERARLFRLWEPERPVPDDPRRLGNHLAETGQPGAAVRAYRKEGGL